MLPKILPNEVHGILNNQKPNKKNDHDQRFLIGIFYIFLLYANLKLFPNHHLAKIVIHKHSDKIGSQQRCLLFPEQYDMGKSLDVYFIYTRCGI